MRMRIWGIWMMSEDVFCGSSLCWVTRRGVWNGSYPVHTILACFFIIPTNDSLTGVLQSITLCPNWSSIPVSWEMSLVYSNPPSGILSIAAILVDLTVRVMF